MRDSLNAGGCCKFSLSLPEVPGRKNTNRTICDPILENRGCTHNSTFVINCNIKQGENYSNKIMQVFNCFDSQ